MFRPVGIIEQDGGCVDCPVGTYESDDTTCSPCALDSYAASIKTVTCTACSGSLGTLDTGSDAESDCISTLI